ncbi:DNA replication complex GINS protein psf3 [Cryptosporidium felis]|nr:DNA replication complex GINS protein psf3 [Cryptosporidium felis]
MENENMEVIRNLMEIREELQKRSFSNIDWDVDYLLMNETLLPCRMVLTQKECGFMSSEAHIKESNEVRINLLIFLKYES